MKKLLFTFFAVFAMMLGLSAQVTVPYTENFDSYTDATGFNISSNNVIPSNYTLGTHTMPTGWKFKNLVSTQSGTPQAFLTSGSSYCVSGNGLMVKTSSSTKVYIALPAVSNATLDELKISFKAKNRSGSYATKISVGYAMFNDGTSVFTKEDFTTTSSFTTYTHDFSQDNLVLSSGLTYYIYLVVDTKLNGFVCIDDVQVTLASSGSDPSTDGTQTTIGTGSDCDYPSPLYSFQNKYYAATWNVYKASELGYSQAVNITKLAYFYDGCSAQVSVGCSDVTTVPIKVYMCTDQRSAFSSYSDSINRANMTLVYSGTPTFAYDQWSDITLNTAYAYNPSAGNLVILVERKQNMPNSSLNYYFRYSSVTNSVFFVYRSNGSTYSMTGLSEKRANIRLTTSASSSPTNPNSYTITAVSEDVNKGVVTGGGTYAENNVATLTATANQGYVFWKWEDGNTSNPRLVTVTADATYKALFQAATMDTITVAAADGNMGATSGSGVYARGTQTTITASPFTHYHFDRWQDGNTTNPRTITVSGNATYTATFAPDSYNISVVANDNSFGIVTGSGTYVYNTTATIQATAASGYHFVNWNDGSTENPRIVTVTHNATYTANFMVDGSTPSTQYTVTLSSNNSNMGSVWGAGTFTQGTTVVVAAIPSDGFRFVSWSDGSTANPYSFVLMSDTALVATFEAASSQGYLVMGRPNNDTYGSVDGSGTYAYGDNVTLTANAASGYQFKNWNDGCTDMERHITVTNSVVYIANFIPLGGLPFYYTVAGYSSDDNMGTVSGGGSFADGTIATLTAVPVAGCHFVRWSNGYTANPIDITVNGDVSYTAVFASDNVTTSEYELSLVANNAAYGTVNGGGTYNFGDVANIEATANAGYKFIMWSDGDTNARRSVVVTGNATYVATFFSESVEVTYYLATINSSNESQGNVFGSGRYPEGSVVAISATANSGYSFLRWNNNATDNPLFVTIVSDTIITAIFESTYQPTPPPTTDSVTITVVSANSAQGQVYGSGRYAKNSVVTIIASPNNNYNFLRWSDGCLDAVHIITATSDMTYTAYFEKAQGIDQVSGMQFTYRTLGRDIVVTATQPVQMALYNVLGVPVATTYGTEVVFNTTAKGIYLLRVGNAPATRVCIAR